MYSILKNRELKNPVHIFLSFLFIINLYISFDYVINQNPMVNGHTIELLLTQNQHKNNSFDSNQIKKHFATHQPITSYYKNPKFDYQINSQNILEHQKFRAQIQTVLSYKPILLQIVINEIFTSKISLYLI